MDILFFAIWSIFLVLALVVITRDERKLRDLKRQLKNKFDFDEQDIYK